MNFNNPHFQEMPIRPEPGEIMLYLDLHRIENMTPIAALKLSERLGFTPQLRYRTWQQEGQIQVGLYALLHYEKREFDSSLEAEYLTDPQFEELSAQIVPDTAVHFAYRLAGGRIAASA